MRVNRNIEQGMQITQTLVEIAIEMPNAGLANAFSECPVPQAKCQNQQTEEDEAYV
jgi:hypothetical protein